jgi:hypothetical protein
LKAEINYQNNNALPKKRGILRQTVAATFPAQLGGLAFLRTALKAVHLTGRAGVGAAIERLRPTVFFMARETVPGRKKSRVKRPETTQALS